MFRQPFPDFCSFVIGRIIVNQVNLSSRRMLFKQLIEKLEIGLTIKDGVSPPVEPFSI